MNGRREHLISLLNNLDNDYFSFSYDRVCLDGNFTLEQLELIIEILKEKED